MKSDNLARLYFTVGVLCFVVFLGDARPLWLSPCIMVRLRGAPSRHDEARAP